MEATRDGRNHDHSAADVLVKDQDLSMPVVQKRYKSEVLKKKKEERRDLARKRKEERYQNHSAAVKIQSVYRGARQRSLASPSPSPSSLPLALASSLDSPSLLPGTSALQESNEDAGFSSSHQVVVEGILLVQIFQGQIRFLGRHPEEEATQRAKQERLFVAKPSGSLSPYIRVTYAGQEEFTDALSIVTKGTDASTEAGEGKGEETKRKDDEDEEDEEDDIDAKDDKKAAASFSLEWNEELVFDVISSSELAKQSLCVEIWNQLNAKESQERKERKEKNQSDKDQEKDKVKEKNSKIEHERRKSPPRELAAAGGGGGGGEDQFLARRVFPLKSVVEAGFITGKFSLKTINALQHSQHVVEGETKERREEEEKEEKEEKESTFSYEGIEVTIQLNIQYHSAESYDESSSTAGPKGERLESTAQDAEDTEEEDTKDTEETTYNTTNHARGEEKESRKLLAQEKEEHGKPTFLLTSDEDELQSINTKQLLNRKEASKVAVADELVEDDFNDGFSLIWPQVFMEVEPAALPRLDASSLCAPLACSSTSTNACKNNSLGNLESNLESNKESNKETSSNINKHMDKLFVASCTERIQQEQSVRIFVATWNQQAKKPPRDLSGFLLPGRFHIYVLGTEECCNSIAKSVIFHSKKEWEDLVASTLGDDYVMLSSHSLTAIHNLAFAHKSVFPWINHVDSDAVATGLANQLGNKGGVGISFSIGSTSFLFIGSHFEAHQNRVHKRNANFHRINTELQLAPFTVAPVKGTFAPVCETFDRIFWLGDLNYRINGTRKMIDALLDKQMHNVLLFNDQLTSERKLGNVFEHFREGPVHFHPTYKFDKDSDAYDTSEKKRIPSWTDRILYRSNPVPVSPSQKKDDSLEGIRLRGYDSFRSFRTSDHRPVYGIFDVAVDFHERNSNSVVETPKSRKKKAMEAGDLNMANQKHSEVCVVQ